MNGKGVTMGHVLMSTPALAWLTFACGVFTGSTVVLAVWLVSKHIGSSGKK